MLVSSGAQSADQVCVWEACSLLTTPPAASQCYLLMEVHDGNDVPHLRAELVGFHLGLLFESVVSVVVREGVLYERREHKHVADPEVDVQRLDGWGSWQGGAGAHHQRGHGENSCDPCRKRESNNVQVRLLCVSGMVLWMAMSATMVHTEISIGWMSGIITGSILKDLPCKPFNIDCVD